MARGAVRRVVIDVPAGDVEIRNVRRDPDRERSREKEQRIVDDTSIEIAVRDREAVVQRRFGPEAEGWRAAMFSDYRVAVEVPRGIDLDVRTKYGDATIDGSFSDIGVGDVHAKLGDESIEHEGFPGNTRYANPSGRTIVNVHVTAGDMNVTLTQ